MAGWIEHDLIRPVEEVLSSVPVAGESRAADLGQTLGTSLNAVFNDRIDQYASWPPGSWIDGATVELCTRSDANSLDVVGFMYLNGTAATFPYRAQITLAADGSVHVVGSLGQVDERTGCPPRLPTGCLIVSAQDDHGASHPELILGHHQVPIAWTKVLDWSTNRR
jgi:hypothetical protein